MCVKNTLNPDGDERLSATLLGTVDCSCPKRVTFTVDDSFLISLKTDCTGMILL